MEKQRRKRFYCIVAYVLFLLFATFAYADLSKHTLYKHGVSENGELQVYAVEQILKDGEVVSEKQHPAYSPQDISNMEGFDPRSKEIIEALTPNVMADLATEKKEPTGVGLEEIVSHDRMVDDLGRISVRRIIRIYENGNIISKKYHRSWIMPGQDPNGNDVISRVLAKKLHTPEVIKKYKAKMAELQKVK